MTKEACPRCGGEKHQLCACPKCGFSRRKEEDMVRIRIEQGKESKASMPIFYKCGKCDQAFKSEDVLKEHYRVSHNIVEPAVRGEKGVGKRPPSQPAASSRTRALISCNLCGALMSNKKYLKRHMYSKHRPSDLLVIVKSKKSQEFLENKKNLDKIIVKSPEERTESESLLLKEYLEGGLRKISKSTKVSKKGGGWVQVVQGGGYGMNRRH